MTFDWQIVHINEGKDKLALFSTKYNVLLTPLPFQFYCPPQYFYSLVHNFIIFPPQCFFIPLLHLHLLIFIVFPPPPPPHLYCFPSSSSSSFVLFFLLLLLLISIVFPSSYSSSSSSFSLFLLLLLLLLLLHHHHHHLLLISIVFPRKDQKSKIRQSHLSLALKA